MVGNHRGFTLLEVLIALLVLSIGLLGLAALQTLGLKFNHESYQRTQAVYQAYDMIDRIRANQTSKASYKNVALGSTPSLSGIDCSTGCNAGQLATYDINTWNTANAAVLRQGRGAICRGSFGAGPDLTSCTEGGNVFRVGVSWVEADLPMVMVIEAEL